MSWVMRLQNQITLDNSGSASNSTAESALHDIIGLFMPSLGGGVFGPDGHLLNGADSSDYETMPNASNIDVVSAPSPSSPLIQRSVSVSVPTTTSRSTLSMSTEDVFKPRNPSNSAVAPQQPPKSILKSESSGSTTSTGPIDIPRAVPGQESKASVAAAAAAAALSSDVDGEDEVIASDEDANGTAPTIVVRIANDECRSGGIGSDAERSHRSSDENISCSGSGEAIDSGAADTDYDADSRSRNPVRRVNSSPEMSSSWRNPFLSQKGAPTAADHQHVDGDVNVGDDIEGAVMGNVLEQTTVTIRQSSSNTTANVTSNVAAAAAAAAATAAFADIEQQRKKSTFVNNMRVSCEAIPEEIAGSTPPSLPKSSGLHFSGAADRHLASAASNAALDQVTKATVLATPTAASAFNVDATKTVTVSVDSGSSSMSSNSGPPKKQLSADDVLPGTASNAIQSSTETATMLSTVKLKLPMDMPKVTTKPPQSPTPLSPRLLAKNAANQLASLSNANGPGFGMGGNHPYGNNNGDNGNSGNGDLIRGRSKTISVVRGEHDNSNRESVKWQFRGSKYFQKHP